LLTLMSIVYYSNILLDIVDGHLHVCTPQCC